MIALGELILLAVLIGLSGIFSGSETALVSITRFKVRLYVKQDRRGSAQLLKLKDNPHRMLTTLLICNNVVNIGASVFATNIALKLNVPNPLAYATGIMTLLVLVFGEVLPKNLATTYSGKIALTVAPLIHTIQIILLPIIIIFDFITVKIFRITPFSPKITEEEVRNIVDLAKEEGGIDNEEKEMIHRIFTFDDIDVNEIKVPRTDMVAIDVRSELRDAIKLIQKNRHSRLPVYEGNMDGVVGIFYFKDALDHIQRKKFDVPVRKIMRKGMFIPETKKIDETLKLFQKKNQHMAIIVDEHGGVSGLVTLEDILEEIVGEIVDETEKVVPEFRKDGKGFRVLGKADIREVNRRIKTKIPLEGDYETLSGYLLHEFQRIPEEGEEIALKSTSFTVKKVDRNRIIAVVVRKK